MATFFTTLDEDMVRQMFDRLDYAQPDAEFRLKCLEYWASRGVGWTMSFDDFSS